MNIISKIRRNRAERARIIKLGTELNNFINNIDNSTAAAPVDLYADIRHYYDFFRRVGHDSTTLVNAAQVIKENISKPEHVIEIRDNRTVDPFKPW